MFRLSSFRLSPMRIIRARPLRRFAPHLLDRSLWRATLHAVGMGMAVGFFFGFLIPVGQIFFAVLLSIFLRGNLLVAASSTFITNPLTTPLVYLVAWKLGGWMLSWLPQPLIEQAEDLAEDAVLVSNDLASTLGTASTEVLLGVVAISFLAAPLGYLIGWGVAHARQKTSRTKIPQEAS
ncbi:MAG: hypothetical protein CGU28_04050 [Candidatus Dactylopiibacterium carminicum]|nr:MAG: hypothetical protein CGU28_04050 [Candidatus Dactylopiibacterium carminicum]